MTSRASTFPGASAPGVRVLLWELRYKLALRLFVYSIHILIRIRLRMGFWNKSKLSSTMQASLRDPRWYSVTSILSHGESVLRHGACLSRADTPLRFQRERRPGAGRDYVCTQTGYLCVA